MILNQISLVWNKLQKTMLLLIFWSATIFPVKFKDRFANLVVELGVVLKLIERVPEGDEFNEVADVGDVPNTGSIQN